MWVISIAASEVVRLGGWGIMQFDAFFSISMVTRCDCAWCIVCLYINVQILDVLYRNSQAH